MELLPKKIKNEIRKTSMVVQLLLALSNYVSPVLCAEVITYLSDQGFVVVLQFPVFLFELNSKLNYSSPMNRCSSLC